MSIKLCTGTEPSKNNGHTHTHTHTHTNSHTTFHKDRAQTNAHSTWTGLKKWSLLNCYTTISTFVDKYACSKRSRCYAWYTQGGHFCQESSRKIWNLPPCQQDFRIISDWFKNGFEEFWLASYSLRRHSLTWTVNRRAARCTTYGLLLTRILERSRRLIWEILP